MEQFKKDEVTLFRRLKTPAQVQDFLNSIPINFENKGETCKSPLRVMRTKSAHCMEGAMLGAYILSLHGHKPQLLDLKGSRGDYDHVVVLFKQYGHWGALSKTNHAVLRYREPIYKTLRELVLSYFHEYFKDNGQKTLVAYSKPFRLDRFGKEWITSQLDLWEIDRALDRSQHMKFLPKGIHLRKADKIERKMGKIIEWKE